MADGLLKLVSTLLSEWKESKNQCSGDDDGHCSDKSSDSDSDVSDKSSDSNASDSDASDSDSLSDNSSDDSDVYEANKSNKTQIWSTSRSDYENKTLTLEEFEKEINNWKPVIQCECQVTQVVAQKETQKLELLLRSDIHRLCVQNQAFHWFSKHNFTFGVFLDMLRDLGKRLECEHKSINSPLFEFSPSQIHNLYKMAFQLDDKSCLRLSWLNQMESTGIIIRPHFSVVKMKSNDYSSFPEQFKVVWKNECAEKQTTDRIKMSYSHMNIDLMTEFEAFGFEFSNACIKQCLARQISDLDTKRFSQLLEVYGSQLNENDWIEVFWESDCCSVDSDEEESGQEEETSFQIIVKHAMMLLSKNFISEPQNIAKLFSALLADKSTTRRDMLFLLKQISQVGAISTIPLPRNEKGDLNCDMSTVIFLLSEPHISPYRQIISEEDINCCWNELLANAPNAHERKIPMYKELVKEYIAPIQIQYHRSKFKQCVKGVSPEIRELSESFEEFRDAQTGDMVSLCEGVESKIRGETASNEADSTVEENTSQVVIPLESFHHTNIRWLLENECLTIPPISFIEHEIYGEEETGKSKESPSSKRSSQQQQIIEWISYYKLHHNDQYQKLNDDVIYGLYQTLNSSRFSQIFDLNFTLNKKVINQIFSHSSPRSLNLTILELVMRGQNSPQDTETIVQPKTTGAQCNIFPDGSVLSQFVARQVIAFRDHGGVKLTALFHLFELLIDYPQFIQLIDFDSLDIEVVKTLCSECLFAEKPSPMGRERFHTNRFGEPIDTTTRVDILTSILQLVNTRNRDFISKIIQNLLCTRIGVPSPPLSDEIAYWLLGYCPHVLNDTIIQYIANQAFNAADVCLLEKLFDRNYDLEFHFTRQHIAGIGLQRMPSSRALHWLKCRCVKSQDTKQIKEKRPFVFMPEDPIGKRKCEIASTLQQIGWQVQDINRIIANYTVSHITFVKPKFDTTFSDDLKHVLSTIG